MSSCLKVPCSFDWWVDSDAGIVPEHSQVGFANDPDPQSPRPGSGQEPRIRHGIGIRYPVAVYQEQTHRETTETARQASQAVYVARRATHASVYSTANIDYTRGPTANGG